MFLPLYQSLTVPGISLPAFQSNVGRLRAGPSDCLAACTSMALLTGLPASFMAMVAALAASITTHVMTCVMLYSAAISVIVFLSLLCVILSAFYFRHHAMLLALKDDNTTA